MTRAEMQTRFSVAQAGPQHPHLCRLKTFSCCPEQKTQRPQPNKTTARTKMNFPLRPPLEEAAQALNSKLPSALSLSPLPATTAERIRGAAAEAVLNATLPLPPSSLSFWERVPASPSQSDTSCLTPTTVSL